MYVFHVVKRHLPCIKVSRGYVTLFILSVTGSAVKKAVISLYFAQKAVSKKRIIFESVPYIRSEVFLSIYWKSNECNEINANSNSYKTEFEFD